MNEKDYAVEHDAKGKPIAFGKYKKSNAAANLLTTVEDFGNFTTFIINGARLSKKFI